MSYRNIFILTDATYVVKVTKNAVRPEQLYIRRPKETRFIARYFPSQKAWRVYDARTFSRGPFAFGRQTYRPGAFFMAPEESTAIMAGMMRLNL